MLRLHLSSYELDLDLILHQLSARPDLPSNFGPIRESVPMARATSFTSAPVRSHNLRFTSAWDWKFSSLMTRAISVILKIHIDPRCSMFITFASCCLCAPSWFGFHEPLLALQDSDVLNSKHVPFVFSPRFKRAPRTMKRSDKWSER